MFKRAQNFFEEVDPDKIKKNLNSKRIKEIESELAFMPVKQEVAVVGELMQKTKDWLNALLETSEENDSFCQLEMKRLVKRWLDPIVVKETF